MFRVQRWMLDFRRFSTAFLTKDKVMNKESLTAYLNDHLAGSAAALDLLEHLGEAEDDDFRRFCKSIRAEVESDQGVLRNLIDDLGAEQGPIKKAAARIMEKAAWAKFALSGHSKNGLGRLEALEGLTLGITGKKALWVVLANVDHLAPSLRKIDFARLISRAENQIERIEKERLTAARAAFS